MHKNKVIQLLASFTRKEMTRFVEFAHSPYHCKHQDVRNLVNYLEGVYPEFKEKKINRHQVYQALFPGKKHRQTHLALIFTYTIRLLEKFFILEQLRNEANLEDMLYLVYLRKKRHKDLYEKALSQVNGRIEEYAFRNSEFFHQKLRFATEADIFYYSQVSRHKKDLSIQEKQDFLNLFFLSEKLKDACEMRLRSKILEIQYQSDFLDLVLSACRENPAHYFSFPAISLYYNLYFLVDKDESSYYFKAKGILDAHHQLFPLDELDSIYKYLQHFCIERINRGEASFLEALFGIFKSQLEQGLLLENGYLLEWHYKNIVTTGLRLGETDWVNQFIENYKGELHPESRENAYIFNKAAYFYEVGEYEKVMDLLRHVEYTDIRYQLGAKSVLLRTYFDLDELDPFLSLADSFRQYLHRNKLLSEDRRKGHLNLIKLARRIFALKADAPFMKRDKRIQEIKQLNKLIEQTDILFNQSWVRQKLHELEQEWAGGPK